MVEQNTAGDWTRGSQEQAGGDWKVPGTRAGVGGTREGGRGSAACLDLTLLWATGWKDWPVGKDPQNQFPCHPSGCLK